MNKIFSLRILSILTMLILGTFMTPVHAQEAYAVYKDGTLTFYCDNQRSSKSGTKYDLNDEEGLPEWLDKKESITKVVFNSSFSKARPKSNLAWFREMSKLTSIVDIKYLNTSEVTNMYSMFDGCSGLTQIDLSNFNTAKLENMAYMFSGCTSLTNIDISKFDTKKVENMSGCFCDCNKLSTINLSKINTSNVKWMELMFKGCSSLKTIDLSKFDTSKVSFMTHMFENCSSLQNIDLSHFNTSYLSYVEFMFAGCSGLKKLDLSNFDISHVSTRFTEAFLKDCKSLEKLMISSSMSKLSTDACQNIGSQTKPCTIIPPPGFSFGVETSGNYFQWNGGYFKLPKQYTLKITVNGNKNAAFDYNQNTVSLGKDMAKITGTTSYSVSEGSFLNLYVEGDNIIRLKVNGEDVTQQYHLNRFVTIKESDEVIDDVPYDSFFHIIQLGEINKNMSVEIRFPDEVTQVNDIRYLLCGDEAFMTYYNDSYAEDYAGLGEVGGYYYEIIHYKGGLKIPDKVNYMGKDYTVTEIMEQAFIGGAYTDTGYVLGNHEIKYVILPTTLKRIRGEAFVECRDLEYVEFPGESLEEIGDGAFSGCESLQYIRMRTKTPATLGTDAFTHQKNTTLYVPTNCKNAYSSASGWKDFKKIAETDNTYPLTITVSGGGEVIWYNDTIRLAKKTVTVWGGALGQLLLCPDNKHIVEKLVINGEEKKIDSNVNSYPLEPIKKKTTVEVTFSTNPQVLLNIQSIGNGFVSVDNEDTYGEDDNDLLWVNPNKRETVNIDKGNKIYIGCRGGFEEGVYERNYIAKIYINGRDLTSTYKSEIDGWAGFWYTVDENTDIQVQFIKRQIYFTHNGITYGYVDKNNKRNVKILCGKFSGHTTISQNFDNDDHYGDEGYGYHTVVEVDDHAFSLCPDLLAVTLPSSVQTIGEALFSGSDNIAAMEVNANVNIYDYTLGDVSNPNFLLYVPAKSYNKTTSIKNVVANLKADSIVLTDTETGNNFYCPKIFTASKISYTHHYQMESGIDKNSMGWETIVLPFDVKSIKHSTKGDLTPFAKFDSTTNLKPFWLYEYSSQGDNGWKKASEIKANTPYIISMPNNDAYDNDYNLGGDVTFSANSATVHSSAATDLIQVAYNNRTFIPTFQQKAKDGINALNVYNQYVEVFNKDNTTYSPGSAFVHELRDVHPFEAYIINSNGSNADFIIFDDMPTGIPQLPILPDVSNFQPGNYRVVNLSGQLVRMVEATSPTEAVADLPAGIYIVNGKKVVVR